MLTYFGNRAGRTVVGRPSPTLHSGRDRSRARCRRSRGDALKNPPDAHLQRPIHRRSPTAAEALGLGNPLPEPGLSHACAVGEMEPPSVRLWPGEPEVGPAAHPRTSPWGKLRVCVALAEPRRLADLAPCSRINSGKTRHSVGRRRHHRAKTPATVAAFHGAARLGEVRSAGAARPNQRVTTDSLPRAGASACCLISAARARACHGT